MATFAIIAVVWLLCAAWTIRIAAKVDGEITAFVVVVSLIGGAFLLAAIYWIEFWDWLPSFERNRFGQIVLWSRKPAPHPQQKERK